MHDAYIHNVFQRVYLSLRRLLTWRFSPRSSRAPTSLCRRRRAGQFWSAAPKGFYLGVFDLGLLSGVEPCAPVNFDRRRRAAGPNKSTARRAVARRRGGAARIGAAAGGRGVGGGRRGCGGGGGAAGIGAAPARIGPAAAHNGAAARNGAAAARNGAYRRD